MTQQNNTTNWLIHDANGQPQMIKVVQSSGKSISGIMTSAIGGQPIKIMKTSISGQESAQTINATGAQVFRAIGTPTKVVTKTVPVATLARVSQRGPDGQIIQKTVRLTPSQMQNLKLVNTATPQKIQIQTHTSTPVVQQTPNSQNQKNYYISPPILDHSGSRKRQDIVDSDFVPEFKRRKTEKVGKGLRHFSMKVCEKVRKKGTTSYNEVADELVGEFTSSLNSSIADQQYDQKNIRRRVYDALNVLMAMNIISKEKKEIKWLGLPTNSLQECMQLEKEKQKRIQSIKEKTLKLHDLIKNQIAFKNLAERNQELESTQGQPPPNSYIQLPFIVVNTNKKTVIDCSISNDKMEYMFHFNDKFEIHDDLFVLKQIGMLLGLDKGDCSPENLEKIKSKLPKALEDYVMQIADGSKDQIEEILASAGPGPSNNVSLLSTDDLLEPQLDEENSRQSSSCDPLSPSAGEYTDEEVDSDMSSDAETN